MGKYKNVIYDLDGTLIDTRPGVKEAVIKTVDDLGLTPLDNETLESFVGPPMQESFQKHFGFDRQNALDAANLFRDNYKSYSLFGGVLYPGIIKMLQIQRDNGIKISVATNKSHENAIAILEHFNIAPFCVFMKGSDKGGKLSKADIIEICVRGMGAEKKDTVYIGDSYYDSEGAERAGIDFIGVTYGFGFKNTKDFDNVKNVSICENVADINIFLEIGDI